MLEPNTGIFGADIASDSAAIAASTNSSHTSLNNGLVAVVPYNDQSVVTAAAAAAAAKLTKRTFEEMSRDTRVPVDSESVESELDPSVKGPSQNKKSTKGQPVTAQKASDHALNLSRDERRRRKEEIRLQREKVVQVQKEAALKRAAELVTSNRVPIEITRGAAAAKMVASTLYPTPSNKLNKTSSEKARSAIIVSTAGDLHQIVTHAKNLWNKYDAIAREHNQKVSWLTVCNELGLHVKVREKYARMHARAERRGFDWVANADWKIKEHPEVSLFSTLGILGSITITFSNVFISKYFSESPQQEPKSKHCSSSTILSNSDCQESDDLADAAAAAAAAVIDASVNPLLDDNSTSNLVLDPISEISSSFQAVDV